MNVGQHSISKGLDLAPNAANLAPVAHDLMSSEPIRFRNLVKHVKTVLPRVRDLTVPLVEDNIARILVWSVDAETERSDLAFPLADSGTGIGQVMAILYVVLNADHPMTIVIDEPSSFLHPGAIRKLFEILRQYPEHQYIVTTHSPTVVAAASPNSLHVISKPAGESKVVALSGDRVNDLKQVLLEVGARISDVFGADRFLWVEGKTEEICFPLIISDVLKRPMMGTVVLSVVETGDFSRKHARKTIRIYRRLSGGDGLLPPAVAFVFDREGQDEKARADLKRQSDGVIHFLDRAMYENYLLHPAAIANVINGIEGFADEPISPDVVQRELEVRKADASFQVAGNGDRTDFHGARILGVLFEKLSENRVQYEKVHHGRLLTEWLVQNEPHVFEEIKDLLAKILPEG